MPDWVYGRVEQITAFMMRKGFTVDDVISDYGTFAEFVEKSERGPFDMLWVQITGAA